ncbi:MAG: signal peptidase I [Mycoplasmatota bacterium]|nr:signal peptidase I [Mycoplasmatota bacterium]
MDFRDIKEFTIDMLKYIFTIFVVIFIIVYVATVQQVVGPSMQPTFANQDIVILNKLHYRFFDIKRFDVVSLNYSSTKYLIKRVIGLPGDKIEYRNNQLYINEKKVAEDFLKADVTTEDFSLKSLGYEEIPDDMYLVLGDNRENSLDSREIGLVKKKDILGKVNLRIWPINKIRYVK